MKHFTSLLISLAALSASAQQIPPNTPGRNVGTFSELGPAPISTGDAGRVAAVACSKTNPNLLYVGAADGGVWKSTNAGTSWTWITRYAPTSAVGSLAIHPTNDQILYVGTGEANFANHSRYGFGILKTTDGGATWAQMGVNTFQGRCISKILINPSNPQVMYASVTTAGGFPELAAAKNHPNRLGALGVFKSTDGGTTWAQLLTGLPNQSATDIALDPSNSQTVYAAIGRIFGSAQNGIYKSIDAGANWTKLAGGLPTNSVGRISLAISPSQSARLYAMVATACDAAGGGGGTLGAYRTDNGGTTWTSLPLGNIQATYGWYLNTVTVRPTDSNVAFFGGYTCSRTSNAGTSFATVTPPHVDLHAFDWDANGNLWCGDDGGIHFSSNLGASWSFKTSGMGTIQFYAGTSLAPGTGLGFFGGLQDNGSAFRNSGGSWISAIGGDGGWTAIDGANSNRMFGEYQGTGTIYRSTNGGGTFNLAASGINTSDRVAFFAPFAIDPNNSNRMLYATQRIYLSTNGGTSYSAISGDVTAGTGAVRSIVIAKSNSSRVYITTNDGLVRMSSNGGVSFTTIRTGHPGWPRLTREVFVDPSNDQHVYLAVSAFGSSRLLESTNAGASFTAIGLSLPDTPVNTVAAMFVDGFWTVFAGADDGLYVRGDSSGRWVKSHFPSIPVVDIIADPSNNRLLLATQGRGAWRFNPIAVQKAPPEK